MKDRNKSLVKMLVIFLFIAIAVIVLWKVVVSKEQIIEGVEYIQSFGVWSMVIFALFYITLVTLSFPVTIFNIGAGVLFSFTQAAIIAPLCAVTAASATFFVSRYFFRDFFCSKINANEKGKSLLNLVESDTGKVIILLRLNPFIPAVIKNYGLGVSNVSYPSYAFFSLIGLLPSTFMYVYLGWISGKSILTEDDGPGTTQWVMLGIGITITLVTLALSHFYFRNKINATQ